MPKGPAKSGKGMPKPNSSGGSKEGLTAACVGDCGRTVALSVVEGSPIREMVFSVQGWSALNTPESGSVSFICPDCFRLMEEEEGDLPLDDDDPTEDSDSP